MQEENFKNGKLFSLNCLTILIQLVTEYRVRQRGCSLTHSARTPSAVHPGITIWVDKIELEKKKEKANLARGFFGGEGNFI